MKKTLAVKEIATFLYASGDLTNEFFSNHGLTDGKRAHSFLQKQYNTESKKEYYVKYNIDVMEYEFTIHGYIDGVLNENGKIILEEIKSTEANLEHIDLDFHKEHLAQLKLYAYIYANANSMSSVNLRLTYISIPEYKTKKLNLTLDYSELKRFFMESIESYALWMNVIDNALDNKLDSLKNITFPFSTKRKGQQELMKACYMTMTSNAILYAIAPTGIGKTMATLFSTLKSIKDANEKVFYLTAKTMGRTVVIDTIRLLESKGLKLHSIIISSKAKSCLLSQEHCDPEACPFAKGYFNRLRFAIEDIYKNETLYDFDTIKSYALKHNICAFEFSLDLSYFCDLIVCDYNYVFDPKAHLVRYFEDTVYVPKILCDEAHNLVERSKDMYSASLDSLIPNMLDDYLAEYDLKLSKVVDFFYQTLENYESLINEDLFYYSHFLDSTLVSNLNQILSKIEVILTDNKNINDKEKVLTLYFMLKDFVDTAEYFGEDHLFIVKKLETNHYEIIIKCCDASSFIYDTVKNKTNGIVFFSATLFPIKYYMDLLTKGNGKYLMLPSPFDPNNLKLLIKDDVSTKYKDRIKTIPDIVISIESLVYSHKGNYIVFFPSYKYIELVLEHLNVKNTEVIIQNSSMNDIDRDKIFNKFKDTKKAHLGLFVLGGSFSEGVDFVGDLLNGVIIVGVGLPQVNVENNLLKEFFEDKYGTGFDYAYTYPGFNKVVQAAGRVIRTETDRGVVFLLDERYKSNQYKRLMPAEWSHRITMNGIDMIKSTLEAFYEEEDKTETKDSEDKPISISVN